MIATGTNNLRELDNCTKVSSGPSIVTTTHEGRMAPLWPVEAGIRIPAAFRASGQYHQRFVYCNCNLFHFQGAQSGIHPCILASHYPMRQVKSGGRAQLAQRHPGSWSWGMIWTWASLNQDPTYALLYHNGSSTFSHVQMKQHIHRNQLIRKGNLPKWHRLLPFLTYVQTCNQLKCCSLNWTNSTHHTSTASCAPLSLT